MGMGIFGIAYSGLDAARAGMVTTQSNISNVNTPGFHRREVAQAAAPASFTGSGYLGSGVSVQSVLRVYSQFLDTEVQISQALTERYNSYAVYADAIDRMLGDPNTGLNGAMQQFFDAANDVANEPTSTAARQSLITSGNVLANRFHSLDASLATMQKSINDQIGQIVNRVNEYTRQIADLNGRIGRFEASTGQPANDLIDMRGQLIEELNKLMDVKVLEQNGNIDLYIGSGQSLVSGATVNRLTTIPNPHDPENLVPAFVQTGSTLPLDSRLVTGGSLGGLLAFREEILKPAQNALDRLAYAITEQFNDIHNDGVDLNGNLNVDFFKPAGSITTQTALGLNTPASPTTISLTIVAPSQLTGSDYILSYSTASGSYTLTRLTDGTNWTLSPPSPMAATGEGFTLDDGGVVPNDGDQWLIRPAHDAARQIGVAVLSPTQIAAAKSNPQAKWPALAFADAANTGTTPIGSPVLTTNPATDANLLQPITITYNAGTSQYVVTGTISPPAGPAPVNIARVPGTDTVISVNGWSVVMGDSASAPANGDVYYVRPTVSNLAASANVGNANSSVTISPPALTAVPPVDPNLAQPIRITYDALNARYVLSGTMTTPPPGPPVGTVARVAGVDTVIAVNGWSVILSDGAAPPAHNDAFTVSFNGLGDNSNARAFAALQTAGTSIEGSMTYANAYGQLVSFVANQTREAKVTGEAQKSLLKDAQTQRDNISGVNLDEEAVRLVQYQQAYQAAAKAIQVATTLFDELLSIGR